ncbi:MAG: hypothetical protein U1A24_20140 [Cypionkella sp.]|uniref:hypothetical protein n=1 Tax=Cypionkella sp. TaxID=2811411 RepID=UPI002ABC9362|nr:hypothetical protein [Cypionkella sp.]MDZ4312864.1 hypothetical protein [Cypionkella sp.]
MKEVIFGVLLSAAPTLTLASGSPSSRLDCTITSNCTQAGKCVDASEAVSFTLTEKDVARHGEGTYEIAYGDLTTEAQNLTPYGPYMWVVGEDEINTMTVLGTTESDTANEFKIFATWSVMGIHVPEFGSVKFLNCEGNF